MNIAAKKQLYAGFHRVLHPGGRLVLQESMAGPVQPPIFPMMWARDAATNCLRTPMEMRAVIEAAGFRVATACTTSHLQGGAPWRSTLELRHKGLLQRHDWTSYEELRPDSRTTKPVSV